MFIALTNNDPTPLYEQIKMQILEQIMNGTLESGTMLPSIRGLAKELKISVITVKKAYEDLETEGYIITSQGKGSFVAQTGAEMIKESRLKDAQQHFEKGISQCNKLNMKKEEIKEIFEKILNDRK
ncbi:MAG: GntR family transcriptional regulator [Clostridia bacterium]|nr:GntR family transcriptional regulator [Clostridia bacterium]